MAGTEQETLELEGLSFSDEDEEMTFWLSNCVLDRYFHPPEEVSYKGQDAEYSERVEKEARFVYEYTFHGNAAKAAREAGYAPSSAKQWASRLLKKPYIKRVVALVHGERAKRTAVDAYSDVS